MGQSGSRVACSAWSGEPEIADTCPPRKEMPFVKFFSCSVEEYKKLSADVITRIRTVDQQVADASNAVIAGSKELTWENAIEPLANLEKEIALNAHLLSLMAKVHTDEKVRAECVELGKAIAKEEVESGMRQDVFRTVDAFRSSPHYVTLARQSPPSERKLLVDRLHRDFLRQGLHLDEHVQAELKALQTRAVTICADFAKNVADDKTSLVFTKAQLRGLNETELKQFMSKEDLDTKRPPTDETKFTVTLQYPDYATIMKSCNVPDTRRQLCTAWESKCLTINTPLLNELTANRARQARLLGKESHAHQQLDIQTAKTPETVLKFLGDLSTALNPVADKEAGVLLKLKEAECKKLGLEYDGKLYQWDLRYYMSMHEEVYHKVDHEEVKKYFPLPKVTSGLFKIYEEMLGLHFRKHASPTVWHDDVALYSVYDRVATEVDADGGEPVPKLLGAFYLDPHPRVGKYGHACCLPLTPAVRGIPDHKDIAQRRVLPVATLITNFTKAASPEEPPLLTHSEVETYFHEFGHVMHHILGEAEFVRFTGFHTETDFFEAPSQMLENWVWESAPLKLMSGHYQTGAPMPDKLRDALVSAKYANVALTTKRQLIFGIFDQRLHAISAVDSDGKELKEIKVDSQQLALTTQAEVLSCIVPVAGSNFSASFAYFIGGYDCVYYGYMWTKADSDDMFVTRFHGPDCLSSSAGPAYRKEILAPGGTRPGPDSLTAFLGRPPQRDAFYKNLGIPLATPTPPPPTDDDEEKKDEEKEEDAGAGAGAGAGAAGEPKKKKKPTAA